MDAAPTADGTDAGPDLTGRTFVSTATRGHDLVDGSTVRLSFAEGRLSARAGCNSLFGGATWAGGVLEAPILASTMMACAPELMDQDTWLVTLLSSSPPISLDGSTLTIGGPDAAIVLVEVAAGSEE